MKFADLGLSEELLKTVESAGYSEPTPIQAQAIPAVMMMRDIIGIAQTGTGKTASFVLPMIDILSSGRRRARMPRSLILEPTRELAAQVAENFESYGKNHDLKMALLIGGVQMGDQVKALDEGVDVLIATPGRLMDLFERGKILLTGCELLVIDEADRMLDMGFIPDIETICSKLPENRQTLLFSATMPGPIEKLSRKFLRNPVRIEVSRAASTNENITAFKVPVKPRQKRDTLIWLLRNDQVETAIVFANRKTTVRELNKALRDAGFESGEIHGDMDQSSRQQELEKFKTGKINILVASDVAARGLDVKGVSHVFNYDAPWHPDDYVHRIGRTGRAGAKGRALTLVTEADEEAIANIETLIGQKIPTFTKKDVRVALSGMAAGIKAGDENTAQPESSADDDSEMSRGEGARKPRRAKPRSRSSNGDGSGQDSGTIKSREGGVRLPPDKPKAMDKETPEMAAAPQAPDVPEGSGMEADDRPARASPKARRSASKRDKSSPEKDSAGKEGEWNGPRPAFLDIELG